MTRNTPLTDDELLCLTARAAALPDAPPGLINKAVALWNSSPLATPATPASVAAPSVLRRVLARLSFDSASTSGLAMGMRSAATMQSHAPRHLLFDALGRDVDLRITAVGNGFSLTGQILGPDETGTVVVTPLQDGNVPGQPAHTADLDDMGSFRFEALPAGRYSLNLRVGDSDIELPTLSLGD